MSSRLEREMGVKKGVEILREEALRLVLELELKIPEMARKGSNIQLPGYSSDFEKGLALLVF